MATQPPSEKGPPVLDSVVQQSILQQAEAAAAAQTNPAGPTTQEAVLQQIDLTSSELAKDDEAPPTYGEIYGEITDEKSGLGTSARVTDDGRVNIRINQVNR